MGIVIKGLFDFDLLKTVAVSVGLVVIIRKIICSKVTEEATMPAILSKDGTRLINSVKFFFQRFYKSFEAIIEKHFEEQENIVKGTSFGSAAETACAVVEVGTNPSKIIEKGLVAFFTVIGDIFKSSKDKEVRQGLVHVMEESKIAKKALRKVMAEACIRIFQIYGNIFTNCHVQGNKMLAMELLAEVALTSVVVQLARDKPEKLTVEFILTAVQNIDHKNDNIFKRCIDNLFSGIKPAGNTDTNKIAIGTSNEGLDAIKIFSKPGVMDGCGNFCDRKDGSSNAVKYGYRMKFPSEDLSSPNFNNDPKNVSKFLTSHKVTFQSLELLSNEALVDEILDTCEPDLEDVMGEIRALRPTVNQPGEPGQATNATEPKTSEPQASAPPQPVGSRKMNFRKNQVTGGNSTFTQRVAQGDSEINYEENITKDNTFTATL